MKTASGIFCAAITVLASLALPLHAEGQSSPSSMPDNSMADMNHHRHPLSAWEAQKRLHTAGYDVTGPLTPKGRYWEAPATSDNKRMRIDMATGMVSDASGK